MSTFQFNESSFGIFLTESTKIPHIISAVKPDVVKLSPKSPDLIADIVDIVTNAFKKETWSLEKEEWDLMSTEDRKKFASSIVTHYKLKR